MTENIENGQLTQEIKDAWESTQVVCVDLEETLVTPANMPRYEALLARYKTLNVETFAAATRRSPAEAQATIDSFRRDRNGRGELAYPEILGTFAPWYNALSNLDVTAYIDTNLQIAAFLQWIKQQEKILLLVSNTPSALVSKIMTRIGIDPSVFDQIITWGDPDEAYPKEDDGTRWNELFNQFPGNTIMTIGDSRFDYEPAVRSGQIGVGVGAVPKGEFSFWLPSAYAIRQIVEGEDI